jgi:hypothetical protein
MAFLAGCRSKPSEPSDDSESKIGQGQCALTIEQSPDVRGLRLGMTLDQVREVFPELPDPPPDEFGWAGYRINGVEKKDVEIQQARSEGVYIIARVDIDRHPETKGVYLRIELVDQHLSLLKVHYVGGEKWTAASDFTRQINRTFGLPGAWERFDSSTYDLLCQQFTVYAGLQSRVVTQEMAALNPIGAALYDHSRAGEPFVMFISKDNNYGYIIPSIRRANKESQLKQRQQQEEERRRHEFKP